MNTDNIETFLSRMTNHKGLYYLVLFLTIIVLYFPSVQGPYILDDSHTISNNVTLRSFSQLGNIWSSARYYSVDPSNWGYRPVTSTTFLLCRIIGGGATWPFHVFKMLIFFAVCFLTLKLWERILPHVNRALLLFALLIFAANPIHTQVVSYIAATTTLLAGMFVLIAVLAYLKFRETKKQIWNVVAMIAIFLGILSKEEGVVALALIPLVELYLRKTQNEPLFRNLPWSTFFFTALGAGLGVGLIIYMFEPTSDLARNTVSRGIYFLTQLRAYIYYMTRYFVAYDLNADNLQFGFSFNPTDYNVILAALANLIVIGIGLWQWNKNPILLMAIAWFYIAISPSSSIIALAEPVNDHRSFISYFGLSAVGILMLDYLYKKINKRSFAVIIVVIFCTYSVSTFMRNFVWSSNELLWRDTVAKNPSSARALNNLAVDLMAKAKYEEASELLTQCHKVGPGYGLCYVNHAIVEASLGNDEKAEEYFKRGIDISISKYAALNYQAGFYLKRGLITKAYENLLQVDAYTSGRNFQVRSDLISLAFSVGKKDIAKKLYTESLASFGPIDDLVKLGQSMKFGEATQ